MIKIIISLFLSGLILGFGPCLVSCGALLCPYIIATKKSLRESLGIWLIFSGVRLIVYLALGAGAGLFGEFIFRIYQGEFIKYLYLSGGGFILLIGILISLAKWPETKLCSSLRRRFLEQDSKSIFLFALISGLSPCAPLLGVLSYIALVARSWIEGACFGLSFGIGTIPPLALLVIFASFIPQFFASKRFYSFIRRLCGLVICLLGLQLIIGAIHI